MFPFRPRPLPIASCVAGRPARDLGGTIERCAVLACYVLLAALAVGCGRLRDPAALLAVPQPPPAPATLVAELAESRRPRQDRDWKPTHAVLAHAEMDRRGATIHNVRRCRWDSESEVAIRYDDWSFRWDEVVALDFVVVPFQNAPLLAHTMFSFALADGRQLVASVEARLERGEAYAALAGAARRFELIYVLGDEQDLLGLRGEIRRDDVYVYRSIASPTESAEILRDVLERANGLVAQPEFYDSLTNNCTSNLVDHINDLRPGSIPDALRKRLPGHSDSLAYELGLLATDLPFPVARRQAHVTMRIRQHLHDPDFSKKIRR